MATQQLPSNCCQTGGTIYSPFTGESTYREGDSFMNPNEDPTFLYCWDGNSTEFAYLSPSLGGSIGDDDPPEVAEAAVRQRGGFTLLVDSGWNGVFWYGFAPTSEDRKAAQ